MMVEEFRETLHEVDQYLGERASSPEKLVEEGVDLLYTLLGVFQACGIPFDDVQRGIETVCNKNDAKTSQTHQIDLVTGKIRRK